MRELAYLLLGWLLGVLSPVISERVLVRYRRNEFIRTAIQELQDLQFRMALLAYRVRSYLTTVDAEFAAWLQPILESYDGPEKDPRAIEGFRKLAGMKDEDRKAVQAALRRPGQSPRLIPFELGYLPQQSSLLSNYPADFQRRVGEISSQLRILNAQADFTMRMFEKTFDPAIVEANRAVVLANLEEGYAKVAARAQIIATAIGELRGRYPAEKSPDSSR